MRKTVDMSDGSQAQAAGHMVDYSAPCPGSINWTPYKTRSTGIRLGGKGVMLLYDGRHI